MKTTIFRCDRCSVVKENHRIPDCWQKLTVYLPVRMRGKESWEENHKDFHLCQSCDEIVYRRLISALAPVKRPSLSKEERQRRYEEHNAKLKEVGDALKLQRYNDYKELGTYAAVAKKYGVSVTAIRTSVMGHERNLRREERRRK